jgi:hypothetical protein
MVLTFRSTGSIIVYIFSEPRMLGENINPAIGVFQWAISGF